MRAQDFLAEAGAAPIYYFAYGMLTDPKLMPGAELIGVGVLNNFAYEMLAYANVVPESGSKVYGSLWNINRELLHHLDRAEGYPDMYDRKTVPIHCNGQRYEAAMYTMTPYTREDYEGTHPTRRYLSKIARGYNNAGIPMDQLYHSLPKDIDEAAMNPKAFAQAVEAGQTKGVLVGFEFEVCVPEATFKNTAEQPTEEITADKVQAAFIDNDVWSMRVSTFPTSKFDAIFQLKDTAPTEFKSMTEALSAMLDQKLNQVKNLFNKIPEDRRAQYRDYAVSHAKDWLRQSGFNRNDPIAKQLMQLKFAEQLGFVVFMNSNSGTKAEHAGRDLRFAASADWDDLFKFVFGDFDKALENFNNYFNYDPKQAWSELQLDDHEDDDWDEDDEYETAANFLQPRVAETMGAKVNVFHSYHQRSKNLTDWYIEPDGSLDADNENDATAEIVSPPLPAAQAIDALKRFYAMAGQLNLYTNKTTGLHINVSIPAQLDVLKLAVFLGDQHVLKQFGREDSRYAISAEKSIKQQAAKKDDVIDVKTKKKTGVLGQPKTTSTINLKALKKLAQDSTSSHFASISNNGKYISFRHAGGNYLADYTNIFNVVGRFIRAMIIAADPAAYAQEYQTKLAKLASTSQTSASQQTPALVNYIRANGLPVIKIDVLRFGDTRSAVNLAKDATQSIVYSSLITDKTVIAQPGGEAARQAIATRMQNAGRKEQVEKSPVQNFFSLTIVPSNINALKNFLTLNLNNSVKLIDRHDGHKDTGYAIYSKAVLPITDPISKTFLKTALAQHFGKKLKN